MGSSQKVTGGSQSSKRSNLNNGELRAAPKQLAGVPHGPGEASGNRTGEPAHAPTTSTHDVPEPRNTGNGPLPVSESHQDGVRDPKVGKGTSDEFSRNISSGVQVSTVGVKNPGHGFAFVADPLARTSSDTASAIPAQGRATAPVGPSRGIAPSVRDEFGRWVSMKSPRGGGVAKSSSVEKRTSVGRVGLISKHASVSGGSAGRGQKPRGRGRPAVKRGGRAASRAPVGGRIGTAVAPKPQAKVSARASGKGAGTGKVGKCAVDSKADPTPLTTTAAPLDRTPVVGKEQRPTGSDLVVGVARSSANILVESSSEVEEASGPLYSQGVGKPNSGRVPPNAPGGQNRNQPRTGDSSSNKVSFGRKGPTAVPPSKAELGGVCPTSSVETRKLPVDIKKDVDFDQDAANTEGGPENIGADQEGSRADPSGPRRKKKTFRLQVTAAGRIRLAASPPEQPDPSCADVVEAKSSPQANPSESPSGYVRKRPGLRCSPTPSKKLRQFDTELDLDRDRRVRAVSGGKSTVQPKKASSFPKNSPKGASSKNEIPPVSLEQDAPPPWFGSMCEAWRKLKDRYPSRVGFTAEELAPLAKYYRELVSKKVEQNRKWRYNALQSLGEVRGAFRVEKGEYVLADNLRKVKCIATLNWTLPSRDPHHQPKVLMRTSPEMRTNGTTIPILKIRVPNPEAVVASVNVARQTSAPSERMYVLRDGKEMAPTWRDTAILAFLGLEQERGVSTFTIAQMTAYVENHWDRICWSHNMRPQWRTILRQEIRVSKHNGQSLFEAGVPGALASSDLWSLSLPVVKELARKYVSRPVGNGTPLEGPSKRHTKRGPNRSSLPDVSKKRQVAGMASGLTTDEDSSDEMQEGEGSSNDLHSLALPPSVSSPASQEESHSPGVGNTAQRERQLPPKLRKRLRERFFEEDGGTESKDPTQRGTECKDPTQRGTECKDPTQRGTESKDPTQQGQRDEFTGGSSTISIRDGLRALADAHFIPESVLGCRTWHLDPLALALAAYGSSSEFLSLVESIGHESDNSDVEFREGMLDSSLACYIRTCFEKNPGRGQYDYCKRVVEGLFKVNSRLTAQVLTFSVASLKGWAAFSSFDSGLLVGSCS